MSKEGLVDLNEAIQHPGRKLSFDLITQLPQEEDIDLIKPVEGELEAVSTGNLLLLRSRFRTVAIVECARCGHPLEQEIEYEITDEFDVEGVPGGYGMGGYAEVVSDEAEPLFQKNHLIRDAWIRQGLLTALPMQPLCEFGWDGPCPYAAEADKLREQRTGHPAFEALKEINITGDES